MYWFRSILLPTLICGLLSPAASAQNTKDDKSPPTQTPTPAPGVETPAQPGAAPALTPEQLAARQAQLEMQFAQQMSGATLAGFFTTDSTPDDAPLRPDRYQMAAVTKVAGDHWLFVYSHKGVPIPLTLKVLWAGDTPVLTLDDFTIAGMGTFSGRIMFHLQSNRYAGTWQHGKQGGLMFGRIEPVTKPEATPAPAPAKQPEPATPAKS